ncbi:MAG: biopolymer transporter ExbD [Planctomycetota bacterium]|nr:biopolymer transporter ExbD [Planctomycetota bacterium]
MGKHAKKPESELGSLPQLNMTPMIDVIFQLLIFFMCTIRFRTMEGKLQSYLPKDRGDDRDIRVVLMPDMRVNISYDEQSGRTSWRFDQSRFTDLNRLEEAIVAKHQRCPVFNDRPVPVIVDADPNVPFSEVVRILDMCTGRGIEKVEFAMPPMSRER